ncbi:hypothetical protein RMSM_07503 [Rhodopirellula maiorica SM1]|uniref:Uncharacterized protein n=1 Tax=Rhodopirellula maiorica SM1 TaxID=1265738 RepID=M5R959_9BACT|nr:hypothetical protein RMSM_07503 [Rhodopirellula maiorica SM1]
MFLAYSTDRALGFLITLFLITPWVACVTQRDEVRAELSGCLGLTVQRWYVAA